MIARRGLPAEKEGLRDDVRVRIFFQLIIERHDFEHIQ